MKVYVFGSDYKGDNVALEVVRNIKKDFKEIEFVNVNPNEDLPFTKNVKFTVIMDAAKGIERVEEFNNLDNIKIDSSTSVHDFDLSFQLKYLNKLGKLGKVKIIALPMDKKKIDYLRIHSILRKLVAQDIQGS